VITVIKNLCSCRVIYVVIAMPRLKTSPSLEELTTRAFGATIAQTLVIMEASGKLPDLETCPLTLLLAQLPINLLESLVLHCVRVLTRSRTRTGLITALGMLPGPRLTQLDLSPLFTAARLSRSLNREVKVALESSLARCSHLTKLVLQSKCTDPLLAVLGRHCPRLQELHISLSEQVTDQGVAHLVPRQGAPRSDDFTEVARPGCPQLTILDLLKCWNVSPAGAEALLLGLPNLSRLMFPNMKSVVELLKARDQTLCFPRLQYFDSSEYLLVTDPTRPAPDSSTANMADLIPQIPHLFPHLTTLRMLLSDLELGLLTQIQLLTHLELELSDDPGKGLQHLLSEHPNRANFLYLFLQVGLLQASHLLTLAQNCSSLTSLRIIGFQVESPALLKVSIKNFGNLECLLLSLYDDMVDSDSEEEEGDGGVSRHTQQILDYFLLSATNLKVANVHMNCAHFLTHEYLTHLVDQNPLIHLERLTLSGPRDLPLGEPSLQYLVDNMPSLQYLNTTRWANIGSEHLAGWRDVARANNLNLVLE
jgi:hypothetical protein